MSQSTSLTSTSPPPLPAEEPPSLTEEDTSNRELDTNFTGSLQQSEEGEDDWQAIYDQSSKSFFFYNKQTKETTWENPREKSDQDISYGQDHLKKRQNIDVGAHQARGSDVPVFQAQFDRRTGRFVADPTRVPENFTADARSDRQMQNFLDLNKLDQSGSSMKENRRNVKHSKAELQLFKLKHKEKRDTRRRAWLMKD